MLKISILTLNFPLMGFLARNISDKKIFRQFSNNQKFRGEGTILSPPLHWPRAAD